MSSQLWNVSDFHQLTTVDLVEQKARRFIGDDSLVETKLYNLGHSRKVAYTSVFY